MWTTGDNIEHQPLTRTKVNNSSSSTMSWIDLSIEKTIFDSFMYLSDIPHSRAISSRQREAKMISCGNNMTTRYFSGNSAECWFLVDLFVNPGHQTSADILLRWGMDTAAQENACVGTFQPSAQCGFFFSHGFWPIGEAQVFCQTFIHVPGAEEGELLDGNFGAGGVHRIVLRATRQSRAKPFRPETFNNWCNDKEFKQAFFNMFLERETPSGPLDA